MRSVYIRPLNFLYGKDAQFHIQKTMPLFSSNKLIAFTARSDEPKPYNKAVSQRVILNYKNKDQVLRDLSNIKKKRNNILNLDVNQPVIMGVLNITPDSFSDGGKFYKTKSANQHAKMMLTQGAHIIDVGGESTRPGAQTISEKEECRRVIQTVKQISKIKKCAVSIDTRKSQVMKEAVKAGATIVNDISALDFDPNALLLVSKLKKPIILNHSQGTPETMQKNPNYQNVLVDIYDYFGLEFTYEAEDRMRKYLMQHPRHLYGEHTYSAENFELNSLGCPLMLGPSRKSFIGKIMGKSDSISRLGGTISSVIIGANQGVQFFRVHDIIEIKEALSINSALHKI